MSDLTRELVEHPLLKDASLDAAVKQEVVKALLADAENRRANARAAVAQEEAGRKWRHSTPLAVALTGLITLAANFGFQYFQKEQDLSNLLTQGQFQADTAALEARLKQDRDSEMARLRADLNASAAEAAGRRAATAEERKFQYELVKDLLDEEVPRVQRAEELLFLTRIGVLNALDAPALERIATATIKSETGSEEAPEATLPGAWISQSSLSPPDYDLMRTVLGEPGPDIAACLVKMKVPFEMVIDWNKRQSLSRFPIHKAAAPYFKRAFEAIEAAGLEEHVRRFAGTYFHRKVRSTSRWSNHAFGIAMDFNITENKSRAGRTQSTMPNEVAILFEEAGIYSFGLDTGVGWGGFDLSNKALLEIRDSGFDPKDC